MARRPNEGMMGEFLANRICSPTETLWHGVLRLAPAHRLIVSRAAGVTTSCYWRPDYERQIRYRTDGQYADHGRALLETVMTAYLRITGPVGVLLSGGFDSCSVLGLIEHLRRGLHPDVPRSAVGSLVFPGMACDERPQIEAAARFWNLEPALIDGTSLEHFSYRDYAAESLDYPGYPNGTMILPVLDQFRRTGVRVAFTGLGADDWFETAIEPALPVWLARKLRGLAGRRLTPSWIEPGLARRIHLEQRLNSDRLVRHPGPVQMQQIVAQATGAPSVHNMEALDRLTAGRIEERHPFCDRRVVQFACALPDDQRRRGSQSRIVLREAMRGLMPEPARQRTSLADFTPCVFARTKAALLADLGGSSFRDFHLVRDGWISGPHIADRFDLCHRAGGDTKGSLVWSVWMVVAMEIWYRSAR